MIPKNQSKGMQNRQKKRLHSDCGGAELDPEGRGKLQHSDCGAKLEHATPRKEKSNYSFKKLWTANIVQTSMEFSRSTFQWDL